MKPHTNSREDRQTSHLLGAGSTPVGYAAFGVATLTYLCVISWAALVRPSTATRDLLTAVAIGFLWAAWLVVLVVGFRSSFQSPPRWVQGLCGVCVAVSVALSLLVA